MSHNILFVLRPYFMVSCFLLLSTLAFGQLSVQISIPVYQQVTTGDTLQLNYTCNGISGAPSITEADLLIDGSCSPSPQSVIVSDVEVNDGCGGSLIYFEIGVQDNCGNIGELSFHVQTIDNTAPTFINPPDTIWTNCIENAPLPDVQDNECLGPIEVIPDNLGILPVCDPPAIAYNRTLFAIDGCGNASQLNQVIVLLDTIPPQLTGIPDDGCEPGTLPAATALDDCTGIDIGVQLEEVIESFSQGRHIIRTWTAEDACGNVAVARRTFVVDTVPPSTTPIADYLIGLERGDTVLMNCEDFMPNVADVLMQDPSAFTTSFLQTEVGGPLCTANINSTQKIEWSATDVCGNISSWHVFVQLLDDATPVFYNIPADTTIRLGDTLLPPTNVLIEDCALASSNMKETYSNLTMAPYNVLVREWSATDVCGRFNFDYQIILINRDTSTQLPPSSSQPSLDQTFVAATATHLSISPNPAVDQVQVQWSAPIAGPASIEVVDVLGRRWLRQKTLDQTQLLDVTQLPAGVYWVRLMDGDRLMDWTAIRVVR